LYFQQAANALKQFQVHFKSKIISMGHFTINLPDNRVGDVRYGKVEKLEFPFRWLFGKRSVDKTGYVVKLHPPSGNGTSTIFSKQMMAGGFRTRMNVFC
jgi:hypothetical protein